MNEQQAVELVQTVKEMLESDPNWLEKLTSPCGKEDLWLIGAFIQTYCIADFNARRSIDALRLLSRPALPRIAAGLNDTDVYLHLKLSLTNCATEDHVKDGISKAAETLELHRIHRHNFAHWVVRRANDYDAFVMLTLKKGDPRKYGVVDATDGASMYGIVPITFLRKETTKIAGHADYLAQVAAYLENKLSQPNS